MNINTVNFMINNKCEHTVYNLDIIPRIGEALTVGPLKGMFKVFAVIHSINEYVSYGNTMKMTKHEIEIHLEGIENGSSDSLYT